MIEVFILFFIIAFAWRIGGFVANWIWEWITGYLLFKIINGIKIFIKKIYAFFKFLKNDAWYWLFRRKKLIKTMRESKGDAAIWALAERLTHTKHTR